ncbi:MAG: hypothetical protein ACTSRW_13725 [Candidatus Helarchaeota archaeon]
MGTASYRFNHRHVYVRERYAWKEQQYFVPEEKHAKILTYIERELKYQLTQDIFLKDDSFVQVIYQDNYLKLRFGTKAPENLASIEAALERFLNIPTLHAINKAKID